MNLHCEGQKVKWKLNKPTKQIEPLEPVVFFSMFNIIPSFNHLASAPFWSHSTDNTISSPSVSLLVDGSFPVKSWSLSVIYRNDEMKTKPLIKFSYQKHYAKPFTFIWNFMESEGLFFDVHSNMPLWQHSKQLIWRTHLVSLERICGEIGKTSHK